jgi:hypothetical protein
VRRNVCNQGLVLDCYFVEGAKCRDKIFCLYSFDLFLEGKEGGSSAQCPDLLSCAKFDYVA